MHCNSIEWFNNIQAVLQYDYCQVFSIRAQYTLQFNRIWLTISLYVLALYIALYYQHKMTNKINFPILKGQKTTEFFPDEWWRRRVIVFEAIAHTSGKTAVG